MKKEIEPFLQKAVDRVKAGELDGLKYEYETQDPYGHATYYHEVSIEGGQIKDSIETHGKSFNGKENERYKESSEKIINTDKGMANFMEKAPYRFEEVLDPQKMKEYKQSKEAKKAAEIQERLRSHNSQVTVDSPYEIQDGEPYNEPNEIAAKKNNFDIVNSLKSLGKLVLILTLIYFAYLAVRNLWIWFQKRRKQKSEKKS